jgi:predicted NAD/FAD-binding protein
MNLLQNLPTPQPVFVTLNPPRETDPAHTYRSFNYAHPIFDQGAISAQSELPAIQGRNHTWFCGSYFGYGFHEDAFASGLRVAAQLDAFREARPNGQSRQRENHAHG